MPDDTKVFDVSKPGRTAPDPTSRPIITDSSPTSFDPIVSESLTKTADEAVNSTTPIHVSMADEDPMKVVPNSDPGKTDLSSYDFGAAESNDSEAAEEHEDHKEIETKSDQDLHVPEGATIPPNEMEKEPEPPSESGAGSNFTPLSTLIPKGDKKDADGTYGSHHVDNLPESHEDDPGWREAPPLPIAKGAGPKRRWPKTLAKILLVLFVLLAAGFLAIDAGLVKSDIKLPFHIFNKQKTSSSTPAPPPAAKSPQPVSQPPAQSAVPTGFTSYKLPETGISFAYPTVWGTPTVTKNPGFSKRGGTNKSDGTYAHIINFATNKDVQIAATSSKLLDNAPERSYYNFLQWCTGTNDKKFYKQSLRFTSTNGVDTPSTITCDQGPLETATKIDDTTILQPKHKESAKDISGDLYTKNLTAGDYTVLRVMDIKMSVGGDIKKLLNTVKADASASSTSTTP